MSTPSADPGPIPDVESPPDPREDFGEPAPDEIVARMAEFSQLTPEGGTTKPSLQFLTDVPVTITARLGQVTIPIGEVLKLGPGAILELDRDVSQPVELTVRGMVFARGEVVVVDDHFAIRIKELVSPRGRGSR
ncbi:flagellar motor switch protein FliN [Zavarzinella formosa]|uniref:flagellar motor switch protein FliN n=1 Tax=Zavarzinella formosa TaxID=360055 RepID=UPI0002E2A0B8|nr:flagellar motor switch protein FliN [Zavarzinella formosa]